jgi:hypothetical protein
MRFTPGDYLRRDLLHSYSMMRVYCLVEFVSVDNTDLIFNVAVKLFK